MTFSMQASQLEKDKLRKKYGIKTDFVRLELEYPPASLKNMAMERLQALQRLNAIAGLEMVILECSTG